MEGGKLISDAVLGRPHHPLILSTIQGRTVTIPGGDATCQDARDGAAIERPE